MKITDYDNQNAIIKPSDYSDALFIQSACNLSGVAYSFVKALERIREEARLIPTGTDWINHHPICVLFTHQMTFLAGRECFSDGEHLTYAEAHEYCTQRAAR